MRSLLVVAVFLFSLPGPVSAGAIEDAPRETRDDVAEVKAGAGSTDEVHIPWTWDDVDD